MQDEERNTEELQTSIDTMGAHLFDRFAKFLELETDEGNETALAIQQEWVVDGQDPEADDYEFTFLYRISELT